MSSPPRNVVHQYLLCASTNGGSRPPQPPAATIVHLLFSTNTTASRDESAKGSLQHCSSRSGKREEGITALLTTRRSETDGKHMLHFCSPDYLRDDRMVSCRRLCGHIILARCAFWELEVMSMSHGAAEGRPPLSFSTETTKPAHPPLISPPGNTEPDPSSGLAAAHAGLWRTCFRSIAVRDDQRRDIAAVDTATSAAAAPAQ